MLVCPGMRKHLLNLGGSGVARVYATHTDALSMNLEHHTCCTVCVQMKKTLQHVDYELHRGEVVIDQQHLKHSWRTGTAAPLFEQRITYGFRLTCHSTALA